MYPLIKKVIPQADFTLLLTFDNDEQRRFDVKPYLDTGMFRELRDVDMFNTATVRFDTVEWRNEADLDPECLYFDSEAI